MQQISLIPMTAEMYHRFFREYENDRAILRPGQEYVPFCYSEETVNAYIQRQIDLRRIPLAIMLGEEIIGELKIWDIKERESAVLGIAMKNPLYMNRDMARRRSCWRSTMSFIRLIFLSCMRIPS